MKKIIAILCMLLLTAQFVLVTQDYAHFAHSIALNEEQKESVGKEEHKEIHDLTTISFIARDNRNQAILPSCHYMIGKLSRPYLAKPTPPPDSFC